MPGWRRRLEAVLQHGHGGEAAGEVRDSAVVGAELSWALEPGSCGLAVVGWRTGCWPPLALAKLARGTTALDTASNIYKLTNWVHVHKLAGRLLASGKGPLFQNFVHNKKGIRYKKDVFFLLKNVNELKANSRHVSDV